MKSPSYTPAELSRRASDNDLPIFAIPDDLERETDAARDAISTWGMPPGGTTAERSLLSALDDPWRAMDARNTRECRSDEEVRDVVLGLEARLSRQRGREW